MISAGTFIVGMVIGYMGQRSGFCTIGGIRDFTLMRDTRLLKGVIAVIVAAFGGFLLLHLAALGGAQDFLAFRGGLSGNIETLYNPCTDLSGNSDTGSSKTVYGIVFLTIIGGAGVGLFSVMADGCPFRQHIRASEGDMGSLVFIAGFYVAALTFGFIVKPIISVLFGI